MSNHLKNPIVLGALALAGLWLVTKRAAAAQSGGLVAKAAPNYATPTAIAGLLSNLITLGTKLGATPATPAGSTGGAVAGSGLSFGGWTADNSLYSLTGWSMPEPSLVRSPSLAGSTAIDSTYASPVYDLASAFRNNP